MSAVVGFANVVAGHDSGRTHNESRPDIGAMMDAHISGVVGGCLTLLLFSGCIVQQPRTDGELGQCDPSIAECDGGVAPDGQVNGGDVDGPMETDASLPPSPDSDGSLGTPCLRVVPNALEYSQVTLGGSASQLLRLESCGTRPVDVTSIRIVDDAAGAFSVDSEALELPRRLAGAMPEDGAASAIELAISFTPPDTGRFSGRVVIVSNDPSDAEHSVDLLGTGVENQCPVAVVEQAAFTVESGGVVTLDGAASYDRDGPNEQPIRYEWTVVSRPPGSLAQPVESFANPRNPIESGTADDLETPGALFAPYAVGDYVLDLTVVDDAGKSSAECERSASVTVSVEAPDGLHIQLTWRTPGDLTPGDLTGSDLDLYLGHPLVTDWAGRPPDATWYCFSLSSQPTWGEPDDLSDDPRLTRDDTNGEGPESITLTSPENTDTYGAPYLVGVQYYRDRAGLGGEMPYGPSFARVRIFHDNLLVWSLENSAGDEDAGERVLEAKDDFWSAVQIEFPEVRVTLRDRMLGSGP